MKTNSSKKSFKGIEDAGLVIIVCFLVAIGIYHFVFGNPANFMNNDPNNHPLPGNMLGTIYKGGIIVPVIQTLLLTVLALSVERFFTLRASFGRSKLSKFVEQLKEALNKGNLEKAQELCDKQRGSVANVVSSTLRKYREMEQNNELSKDQKTLAIQKGTGGSHSTRTSYDATEPTHYRHNHHFRNFNGIAWNRNRYDPFICRTFCRRGY